MDPATYYATTLTNAAKNLGPIILYLIAGYLIFIKLPFMLMMKVNKENKPKVEDDFKGPKLENKPGFKPPQDTKIKLDSMSHTERMQQRAKEIDEQIKRKEKEREEERLRQEKKKAERDNAKAQEEAEKKSKEAAKNAPPLTAAAKVFDFKLGEEITKKELKKRYHKLLRENHPDKVAEDKKTLAEKKTKEINSAYEELEKKAS
jgi:Pyruvate/2-oxoacid:ferredoxin oxidoreductase gamma subunit